MAVAAKRVGQALLYADVTPAGAPGGRWRIGRNVCNGVAPVGGIPEQVLDLGPKRLEQS